MQCSSSIEELSVVSDVEDLSSSRMSYDSEPDQDDAVEVPGKRSRVKKLPARFRDSDFVPSTSCKEDQLEAKMRDRKLAVKCNQTGKLFKVKTTSLSKEDEEPLSREDLVEGTQLLLTMHNKSYPVTFREVLSEVSENSKLQRSKLGQKSRKRTQRADVAVPPKKQKVANKENLLAAKAELSQTPQVPEPVKRTEEDTSLISDRELLLQINAKLDRLLALRRDTTGIGVCVKKESGDEDSFMVNEVNLLRVPAKDAYAYGRSLLDLLFTKNEQKASVVTRTKKSEKPPLDPKRVEKLFACVSRRYGDSYCHKQLMTTLGQKCRDAKPDC